MEDLDHSKQETSLYKAGKTAFLKLREAKKRGLRHKGSIDYSRIENPSLIQLVKKEISRPLHFLEEYKGVHLERVCFLNAEDDLFIEYSNCAPTVPAEFSFLFNAIALQPSALKKFSDRETQAILCHELTHNYHYNYLFPFLLAEMNKNPSQKNGWQQEFFLLSDAEAYRMAFHLRYDSELGGKEYARGRLADAMIMSSIFGSRPEHYKIRTHLEQLLLLEEQGAPIEEELIDLRLCFPWEKYFLKERERYKGII